MITGEVTSSDVFRILYESEMPESYAGWTGWRDGEIIAEVGIHWDNDGQAWLNFSRFGHLSAFTIYRFTKRLFAVLKDIGVFSVQTGCDEAVRGAVELLERLGFKRHGLGVDGKEIWRYDWIR